MLLLHSSLSRYLRAKAWGYTVKGVTDWGGSTERKGQTVTGGREMVNVEERQVKKERRKGTMRGRDAGHPERKR